MIKIHSNKQVLNYYFILVTFIVNLVHLHLKFKCFDSYVLPQKFSKVGEYMFYNLLLQKIIVNVK